MYREVHASSAHLKVPFFGPLGTACHSAVQHMLSVRASWLVFAATKQLSASGPFIAIGMHLIATHEAKTQGIKPHSKLLAMTKTHEEKLWQGLLLAADDHCSNHQPLMLKNIDSCPDPAPFWSLAVRCAHAKIKAECIPLLCSAL